MNQSVDRASGGASWEEFGSTRTTGDMPSLISATEAGVAGGGYSLKYEDIISIENLLLAWKEFVRGKRGRKDVQEFELDLMGRILQLNKDLLTQKYKHSAYEAFNISDPKPRSIHKASVRDRLLHHALYRILYPFFDRTFITDSYSCRENKGTHKALDRFRTFERQVSGNHEHEAWVLKCDVRKFFASIDQERLLSIVSTRIRDQRIIGLLEKIVHSFDSDRKGKGLPLGNLTSQLLVNVYMNEFDQFIKNRLKARFYVRYADDFVVLSDSREWLGEALVSIGEFLRDDLQLSLHPDKVSISKSVLGIDFLGWVHFPDHRVLRTATKRRMFRGVAKSDRNEAAVQSYLGLLSHGNTWKLRKKVAGLISLTVA